MHETSLDSRSPPHDSKAKSLDANSTRIVEEDDSQKQQGENDQQGSTADDAPDAMDDATDDPNNNNKNQSTTGDVAMKDAEDDEDEPMEEEEETAAPATDTTAAAPPPTANGSAPEQENDDDNEEENSDKPEAAEEDTAKSGADDSSAAKASEEAAEDPEETSKAGADSSGDVLMEDDSERKIDDVGDSDRSTADAAQNTNGSSQPEESKSPPPPIMKGTLSYEMGLRRHLIRGMWNYENSTSVPPQRFELLRSLAPDEEVTELPKDGEFHGSFSLVYTHVTSKGKRKERSKVIPETGVNIKFTRIEGKPGEYNVDGKGTNQFGIFHINGTATPSTLAGDPTMNIVLRKRYEPASAPPAGAPAFTSAPVAPKSDAGAADGAPLPPPAESYETGVVCLRGKVSKSETTSLGLSEVVHKISGFWASGLNFIVADPENANGMLSRFEYEHKSIATSSTFPVSGRYSGWFDLMQEDGSRTKINERDVTLKFRKNSAGYHNVEGKGSNAFGKYTITGTLSNDSVITIFRHFAPRKIKAKSITSAPPPLNAPQARRASAVASSGPAELKLKLDDVVIPDEKDSDEALQPLEPPVNGLYSAVSRGVLRLNDDGSHSCSGKWAVTREHFTNNQTSGFSFRLEAHHATEAAEKQDSPFPLDSIMYKGSFQLKKPSARSQTIVDHQVVMKFRMNTQGAYNVYGKGLNAIGEFNLTGTLILSGKTGGQVELYRTYPPERLANPLPPKPVGQVAPPPTKAPVSRPPAPGQLQRRESSRAVKPPTRLDDDDPSAQLVRSLEKCSQILRIIRERDIEMGAFFAQPVDPVKLGIPTYTQIIKEPMDLKTVHQRMESSLIQTPEEFARLVRLVFENAMKFNIDPTHAVHQAARQLLTLFNQKYRDVERMIQTLKRVVAEDAADSRRRAVKEGKRKRDEPASLRAQRYEEAQHMAADHTRSVSAILAAGASAVGNTVTRAEFTALLQAVQQLQTQVVRTFNLLAELSPGGDDVEEVFEAPVPAPATTASYLAPPPEKKKKAAPKRKQSEALIEEEYFPPEDDDSPLSLEEQEQLTEIINELPPDQLGGVIQIIREAAPVGADEEEIDLEIDQLDNATQRKLYNHVMKVCCVLLACATAANRGLTLSFS